MSAVPVDRAAPAVAALPAVEVLSAHKTYANGTQALLPVELTVREGEFVTLLGPSGCGKSTLLKMVAGLLEPSDGRLLLWRKPVQQVPDTGHALSFVFQEATLMPWAIAASWSNDTARATEVAKELECGTAWVNQHLAILPSTPFGGAKWSGIGPSVDLLPSRRGLLGTHVARRA